MPSKTVYSAGATYPELYESVDPVIGFLSKWDSPLLVAVGYPNALDNIGNSRHEWVEERLNPNSSSVVGAQTSGDTTIEVTAGTGTRFRVGDTVQVDGSRELMAVGAVAANNITVTRAIRGTTAEAVLDGALIKRLFRPAEDCADAPEAQPTLRPREENYTQIFQEAVTVCRSMLLSNVIGVSPGSNEEEHQRLMVERDLARQLADAVINGRMQSSNPEGASGTPRTMDGIIQSILKGSISPVIVDAGNATLDEGILNGALEQMFQRGATPNLIAASGRQKRALSDLLSSRQRFEPMNRMLGAIVDTFQSDYYVLNVLAPDNFIPSDCLLILDTNRISIKKLGQGRTPWDFEPLAKTGLANKAQVVGEFTLEIKNANDGGHALIQNLAT